jgi:hypothetical protein
MIAGRTPCASIPSTPFDQQPAYLSAKPSEADVAVSTTIQQVGLLNAHSYHQVEISSLS